MARVVFHVEMGAVGTVRVHAGIFAITEALDGSVISNVRMDEGRIVVDVGGTKQFIGRLTIKQIGAVFGVGIGFVQINLTLIHLAFTLTGLLFRLQGSNANTSAFGLILACNAHASLSHLHTCRFL